MRKRIAVVAVCGTLVVGMGLGAMVLGGGPATAGEQQTFRVENLRVRIPGNGRPGTAALWKAQLHRGGDQVGSLRQVCTFMSEGGGQLCTLSARLPNGEIEASGFWPGEGNQVLGVTGGFGEFVGASGRSKLETESQPRHFVLMGLTP
jgi:hypothetical protein